MSDDDLTAELDRLDKAAAPQPWTHYDDNDDQHEIEDVSGGAIAALPPDTLGDTGRANAELIVWLRNHTDEIKAALGGAIGDVVAEGVRQKRRAITAEAERDDLARIAGVHKAEADRLRTTVQRVEDLGRRLVAAAVRQRQWTGMDRYNLGVADAKEEVGEAILKALAEDDSGAENLCWCGYQYCEHRPDRVMNDRTGAINRPPGEPHRPRRVPRQGDRITDGGDHR